MKTAFKKLIARFWITLARAFRAFVESMSGGSEIHDRHLKVLDEHYARNWHHFRSLM
jgi:hypothetical protein